MIVTNISNARRDLIKLIDSCIDYEEVVDVVTGKGNVVLLNEQYYNDLVESIYLSPCSCDIREVEKTPSSCFSKQSPFKQN